MRIQNSEQIGSDSRKWHSYSGRESQNIRMQLFSLLLHGHTIKNLNVNRESLIAQCHTMFMFLERASSNPHLSKSHG